jgi:hypothetical protein
MKEAQRQQDHGVDLAAASKWTVGVWVAAWLEQATTPW